MVEELEQEYTALKTKVHDLRDSCSTNLANVPGLSPEDRMRWLAHRDKETNDLYTKFDDDRARFHRRRL